MRRRNCANRLPSSGRWTGFGGVFRFGGATGINESTAARFLATGLWLPLHELDDHGVATHDHLAKNFLTRGQDLARMRGRSSAPHVVLDLPCPLLHAASCIGNLKIGRSELGIGRTGPLTVPSRRRARIPLPCRHAAAPSTEAVAASLSRRRSVLNSTAGCPQNHGVALHRSWPAGRGDNLMPGTVWRVLRPSDLKHRGPAAFTAPKAAADGHPCHRRAVPLDQHRPGSARRCLASWCKCPTTDSTSSTRTNTFTGSPKSRPQMTPMRYVRRHRACSTLENNPLRISTRDSGLPHARAQEALVLPDFDVAAPMNALCASWKTGG